MTPGWKIDSVKPKPAAIRTATEIISSRGCNSGRSGRDGIDVPGICRVRQLNQPASDVLRIHPLPDQRLAFPKGRVEAPVTHRRTPLDAGKPRVALDGSELKRKRVHRS